MSTGHPDALGPILARTRERESEWVELVETLARLESPSDDIRSQGAVLDRIAARLSRLDYRLHRIPGRRTGGLLVALPHRPRGRSGQLLLGHTDTVWPRGTLATMPVVREGRRLRGPGVFDMKAGLAQMILALETLHEMGLTPAVSPIVLVNSDEEIESPESTRHIRRLARRVCRVFVLEPALGGAGRLKTSRRGTGHFRIRVQGVPAHSGLDPEKGSSAIQELALLVLALHALSEPDRGIHVNVGVVRGGTAVNTIAGEAIAEVDLRVDTLADAEEATRRIRGLRAQVPGCRLEVEGGIDRPPFEPTPGGATLWRVARETGARLGLTLQEGRSGGASDGNTTAPLAPTLDGLGAVGDGAHAAHEFVEIDRCLERSALLASLLLLPEELPTEE